jgi:peroxiredoxin
MSRFLSVSTLLLLVFSSPDMISAEESGVVRIGKPVADFTLQDFRGKKHSLGDYQEAKLVVIAFLGTECPLAKLYGPRLQRLADRYDSTQVVILGVNSNSQDAITEIAAYARIHDVTFPLLKDTGNRVADAMAAVRTPEVFLLDQQRRIAYWGRIDDQYGVGVVRTEPTREDLKIAIDELLAGKRVSQSIRKAEGCFIGRIRKPDENSDVTYSNQVSRILQKRCVQCHRKGEIAPFSLEKYEDVVGWAETISEVVKDNRMPPWHASKEFGHFVNDRRLSDEEKNFIYRWVESGAPRGDVTKLPVAKNYTAGWQLPKKPDLVLPISKRPYPVPAEGVVRYQYFRVNPGFKEDKWIQAAELLPGNRAVVHHILAFARVPGERGGSGGLDGFLVGYVPGLLARPFPEGMAKRIPAGSELIFQVHYSPIGSAQMDASKIGFVFADPDDVKYEVKTTSAAQRSLRIPAGDDNHRVTATSRSSREDALLLGFMPHMHVRGKSFRYESVDRDGERVVLLDVPKFDFNWQTSYRLAEPVKLAAGTRIYCTAHFDNSRFNLNNPDPTKMVRWGDQTWEEMMIGYFDVAVPKRHREPAKSSVTGSTSGRAPASLRDRLRQADRNKNGKLEKSEASGRLGVLFLFWDQNRDGVLSDEEIKQGLERVGR